MTKSRFCSAPCAALANRRGRGRRSPAEEEAEGGRLRSRKIPRTPSFSASSRASRWPSRRASGSPPPAPAARRRGRRAVSACAHPVTTRRGAKPRASSCSRNRHLRALNGGAARATRAIGVPARSDRDPEGRAARGRRGAEGGAAGTVMNHAQMIRPRTQRTAESFRTVPRHDGAVMVCVVETGCQGTWP